ncbi:unnamed protein product [Arctia plantaginis]|uniref:DDE Tnp4 domain-containing protein n=1 Tax=Arctia plantaginis TaxID=874455 RepID=A0A8S0YMC6_ARCPL|nr:unnamed protein product [Arctia plantaginis]
MSCIIWDTLKEEFMKLPDNENKWENIANGFGIKANFPHYIGAVDGKHIRVVKPNQSGSMYFNYKGYFSFVLLAVVDAEYRFIYISVGSYGNECDSSIFKETTFWKKLNDGSLNIPKPLHETIEKDMPYVLVGDEAFPLTTNLMRPFGGNHLNDTKRIFNYRLCRARRFVACAFGILANKWRILHRPLDVHPDTAIHNVKACAVLHNYLRERDGLNFEDIQLALEQSIQEQDQQQRVHNPRGGPIANVIRSDFADYFTSPIGSLPWQTNARYA